MSEICDTETIQLATSVTMSPQAPPISPITPQTSVATEVDNTSQSNSTLVDSAQHQSEDITTPNRRYHVSQ